MDIRPEQILGVTAVCRPPNLDGLLSFVIPLLGERASASTDNDELRLALTDTVANHLEQLLKLRRERGI